MNSRKIFWGIKIVIQFIPLIFFLYSLTIIPDDLQGDAIAALIGLFLIIRGFIGDSTLGEIAKIKKTPFLEINQLNQAKNGLIKLKGKLKAKKYSISPLAEKKCIGYSYKEQRWIKKKIKRDYFTDKKISRKLKTIKYKKECNDFYFYDKTGEILVVSDNIDMLTPYNNTKKQKNGIQYHEDLLEEDKEYYLMGFYDSSKKQINKGFANNKEFFVIDPKYYNLLEGGSLSSRIGCGFFILILVVLFFGTLTFDYWLYMRNYFIQQYILHTSFLHIINV